MWAELRLRSDFKTLFGLFCSRGDLSPLRSGLHAALRGDRRTHGRVGAAAGQKPSGTSHSPTQAGRRCSALSPAASGPHKPFETRSLPRLSNFTTSKRRRDVASSRLRGCKCVRACKAAAKGAAELGKRRKEEGGEAAGSWGGWGAEGGVVSGAVLPPRAEPRDIQEPGVPHVLLVAFKHCTHAARPRCATPRPPRPLPEPTALPWGSGERRGGG